MNERSAARITVAVTCMGLALQIGSGHFKVPAVFFLAGAFVALCLAVRAVSGPEAKPQIPLVWWLAGATAVFLVAHLFRPPGIHLDVSGFGNRSLFNGGLLVVGVLVAGAVFRPDHAATLRTPLMLLLFFAMGAWVIQHAPNPRTDVILIQREAIAHLLAGGNPYSMTFPNIYGENSGYYGPGMVAGDRVLYGYSYPPILLLLALPGHLLGLDLRFSHLAVLTLAGAFIAYARPGRIGFLAATLFLFAPRTYFVLEQSWTDSFVVGILAFFVFCACRWRSGFPFSLGALICAKQYIVLALPLLWLVRPQLKRAPGFQTTSLIAVAFALVLSLPLALWDFSAFWRDLFVIQSHLPFRMDSLSFSAAFAHLTGIKSPTFVGFMTGIAGIIIALRRLPASPASFAFAFGWVMFLFFAFNRQAFCNYYFVVLGALAVALGARDGTRDTGISEGQE
ncbi:MAG TPA: hypothetical protein VGF45_05880 [Polyangia bacterium]